VLILVRYKLLNLFTHFINYIFTFIQTLYNKTYILQYIDYGYGLATVGTILIMFFNESLYRKKINISLEKLYSV